MPSRLLHPVLPPLDPAASSDARAHTRHKLLDAAQQVFLERGYFDATIRDICQRAGLNLALVNYHFGDKLGLYTEVLRSCTNMTSQPEPLQHVAELDADPVSLLRDLVAMFLRNMRKNDSAFDKFMQQERLRPTPAMAYLIETSMRPAYQATCALVGRVLDLPADHLKTRLATHSVIAQIKHFGEPERLLTQLDPTILANQSVEDLAEVIVNFALASFHAPNEKHRVAGQTSTPHPGPKSAPRKRHR